MKRALQIRYVKLRFGLRIAEDTRLPVNKVSAIRGGIGEMLLRANCIRDRQCKSCDFESECIVRRTLYSRFEEKPDFVTSGDSVGYVLECENYNEDFQEGDILEFHLILFGKTIVYFSQFLQAVHQLGLAGVGKAHARYTVASVRNTVGKDILRGSEVFMEHYQVLTLWDYVTYRQKGLTARRPLDRICFQTPVTLKYQGKMQQSLSLEAMIPALCRRIYMLDCFEGIDCEQLRWGRGLASGIAGTLQTGPGLPVFQYTGSEDVALGDQRRAASVRDTGGADSSSAGRRSHPHGEKYQLWFRAVSSVRAVRHIF